MHALLRHLESVAKTHAQRVALIADGEELSFSDLWSRAHEVAHDLRSQGIGAGDRVAVVGDRGVQDFVHMLGAWLAGAAYVPIGTRVPSDRARRMLVQAGVCCVLQGRTEHLASRELWVQPLVDEGAAVAQDDGLAYLIFTSGSTGEPKGVPITHDNLLAYLQNIQSRYPLRPEDRVAQLAELSFDASVHEWVGAWYAGATLCVVPTRAALMWPRYVAELSVTSILVVPSSVVMARSKGLLPGSGLPALRQVFLGGEAVPLGVARSMRHAAPGALLVNLYGPTEGTIAITHFPIDLNQPIPDLVPIGSPFDDQAVQVWDEADRPVGPGETGELVFSGAQVARAYWGQDDLAGRRWTWVDGRRWYRSGDLAREVPPWGLVCLGRLDRQVKVKGYRIELQDIEQAMLALPGVERAVVVLDGEPTGAGLTLLRAFWAGPSEIESGLLFQQLAASLPEYMVPQSFQRVTIWPVTESGKTDYKALADTLAGRNCDPV